jgi:hypothetical protein
MIVEEDAAQERAWLRQDPQLEQEWLRQNNLIYGGLIAIGVYLVQPFLTTASLDLSATICVVAFSVAIPLLAALVIVNRQEANRRRRSKSVHSAGYWRLERDQVPTPQGGEEPGGPGSWPGAVCPWSEQALR